MAFALGSLRWPPDAFWRSTPYELSCAYIRYCQENQQGRWAVHPDGWSDVMIEEFKVSSAELVAAHSEPTKPSKAIRRAIKEGRDREGEP